jgi:gas vesicle structural protein
MSGYLERPAPSGLADVIEVILDKGLVIDAYVRVSVVGIELVTIDARIVIASVDTYLRFAEATNRLDLEAASGKDIPETIEAMRQAPARGITSGVISGVKDAFTKD